MKHFQDLGHTAIFLIGDFTGLIGDPSGRSARESSSRRKKSSKTRKPTSSRSSRFSIPDNDRHRFQQPMDVRARSGRIHPAGSRYTVARILEREDFTNRMKNQQPIAMHELLYPLVQGYDSVALEADVELGRHRSEDSICWSAATFSANTARNRRSC